MATPIAHKAAVTGAKITAMTALDLLTTPELVAAAHDYFDNVQTKDIQYVPFEGPDDVPPIAINADTQARYREDLAKFYYDPSKYRHLS